MNLSLYHIDETNNLDSHVCFKNPSTYPNFQEDLINFKSHLKELVDNNKSKTFYKFGDGDYHFLKKNEINNYIDRFKGKKVAIWGAGHQSLAVLSLANLSDRIS